MDWDKHVMMQELFWMNNKTIIELSFRMISPLPPPGGVLHYIGYIGFYDFKGYGCLPFWSKIGYGLCTLV